MATRAPSSRKRRAIALLIPELPPVTKATRFASRPGLKIELDMNSLSGATAPNYLRIDVDRAARDCRGQARLAR
jgi:hypothetical protein